MLPNRVAQNSGPGLIMNETNFPGGSISIASAGMDHYDMTTPAPQAVPGLKNYYAVYLDYRPDNAATDRIYGVAFNVNFPAGMVPVSANGLVDPFTTKYLAWNPTDENAGCLTWDGTGDAGDNNFDLRVMCAVQTDPTNASYMRIGTPAGTPENGDPAGYQDTTLNGQQVKGTLLGLFALQFTTNSDLIQGEVSLTAVPGGAGYWRGDQLVYDDSAFHGSALPSGTPEPASLALLGMGAVALVFRRHHHKR
jgi:hypothetical protein